MRKAFTLMEVVITIALFAILVLGVSQLYLVFGRTITEQSGAIRVTLGGSALMDAVRSAGLQASHVVATHTFSGTPLASGATVALFELPAVNASGSVIANTYDYVGIYAEGAQAYRVVDGAPGSVRLSGKKRLTDALDALSFTYDNASFSAVTSFIAEATT
ncbi:MAG: prepilin-type N-terminal cleavage/methylation domain-containing protein, partial [Candidatus Pacebacteria bacterium]|nr:prepilin-type N-terminal cleavage/methylation domain-containing protein [Candidatus Paceibacterota bacterium]